MTEFEKKKRPIWGLVGLVLIVLGIVFACQGSLSGVGYGLLVMGGIVLVAALFTGNVKLFG